MNRGSHTLSFPTLYLLGNWSPKGRWALGLAFPQVSAPPSCLLWALPLSVSVSSSGVSQARRLNIERKTGCLQNLTWKNSFVGKCVIT